MAFLCLRKKQVHFTFYHFFSRGKCYHRSVLVCKLSYLAHNLFAVHKVLKKKSINILFAFFFFLRTVISKLCLLFSVTPLLSLAFTSIQLTVTERSYVDVEVWMQCYCGQVYAPLVVSILGVSTHTYVCPANRWPTVMLFIYCTVLLSMILVSAVET